MRLQRSELNRLFSAWLEVVYHRRVHSETKTTPLERFDAAGAPRLPTPVLLREAFLWSLERVVTKTATVSLHANSYEVDAALVGRKVELVFDPFDLTRIEVRYQHRPMGTAVPLVIGRRTHPQTARELPPPPTGTGIDYLKLLAEQRDECWRCSPHRRGWRIAESMSDQRRASSSPRLSPAMAAVR